MLVAVLIPVLLLIATMLMETFESRILDLHTRRRPIRAPRPIEPARSETVAQRHLKSVAGPESLVVDVGPAAVVDQPLRQAS